MKIPDGYYEASPGVLERRKKYVPNANSLLPDAELECDQTPTLDEAVQGEEKGFRRTCVRFTLHRVKYLDPDNAAGSVKDLLDGLRHAGLLSGDEWYRLKLEIDQEKVAHYAEEKTVITIMDITPQQ